MRPFTLFATSLALLASVAGAEAQNSRSGLYIEAKPRSWLDAGKVVEPHSMQNYMYDTQGISAGSLYSRGSNLPDRFSGGSAIKIDIPAPEFLRQ